MAANRQFASIEGLTRLRRLLKPIDELVAQPWKEAMTELAESGAVGGKSAAPRRSGRLQGKIYARVQNKPFPMWAAVRSRAKRRSKSYPRGYGYPTLLEYSNRHGHKGWFMNSVKPLLIGKAEAVLSKAGDKIAKNWGRK